jgi:membrane protease YdiL (CAAX protease family)
MSAARNRIGAGIIAGDGLRTMGLYVASLVVAFIVIRWVSLVIGIAIVLAVAIASLAHAAHLEKASSRRSDAGSFSSLGASLRCFALVAIIGVMPYLLPLAAIPAAWAPAVLAVPCLAGILALRHQLDGSVGFRWIGRSPGHELAFALIGVPLGALARSVAAAGTTDVLPPTIVAATGLIVVAAVEEIAARGYLQSALGAALGAAPAVAVAAVTTAAPAVGDLGALSITLVAGALFGWWVHRGNGVLGAALAHGVTLIVLFLWPVLT